MILRNVMTAAAASLLLISASCPGTTDMPESSLPPARDGDIAIQQELDAARKAATVESYDLFIARHPEHPLADLAREERARLIAAHSAKG